MNILTTIIDFLAALLLPIFHNPTTARFVSEAGLVALVLALVIMFPEVLILAVVAGVIFIAVKH